MQGTARLVELGSVINKIRVVQGWNILGPAETAPVAAVWAEQLDRFDVPVATYGEVLNRCIDFRRKALLENPQYVPALSVELFLAMFKVYQDEAYQKLSGLARAKDRTADELKWATEAAQRDDDQPRQNAMDRHNSYETNAAITDFAEYLKIKSKEAETALFAFNEAVQNSPFPYPREHR